MGSEKDAKQFVKLNYELIHSSLWRNGTTVYERDIYTQIRASRNRKNPDGSVKNVSDTHIEFGFSDSFGMSKNSFVKAIEGLRAKGIIRLIKPGKFPNRKAVYALSEKWKRYNKGHESCQSTSKN